MTAFLPLAVLFLSVQIPGPSAPAPGPSADATKQIEARRDVLKKLNLWFARPSQPLPDADARAVLQQLAEAVSSKDEFVYDAATSDLLNGMYRVFPADDVKRVLLPTLKLPEKTLNRQRSQSFVMEYLARHYGPKASEALPDLLKIVREDTASPYLRGQAIDAAAKIGPGAPLVVEAFIAAIENPNPKNSSGVHGRAAYLLGDMGKAAWPAKKAMARLLDHPWYAEAAYIALGKLAMDDPPQSLDVYLARLRKVNELTTEQASAAFLHVQKIVCPDAPIREPNYAPPHAAAKSDPAAAAAARPVLLLIVEDGKDGNLHARAALRALQVVGPGGSERAARVLVRNLTRPPSEATFRLRHETAGALSAFEASDPKAVPILADGLDRLLESPNWTERALLAQTLGKFGHDARPAELVLRRGLEQLRLANRPYAHDELKSYTDALVAIGAGAEARAVLLHLLDLDGPAFKQAGPDRPRVHATLLRALAHFGVPPAGEEREAFLDRLRAGLADPSSGLFTAAATAVIANGKAFTEKEAAMLLPLLRRPLATDPDAAEPTAPDLTRVDLPFDVARLGNAGMAVRALGALGPNAREVLGELDALAARPLRKRGDYMPEPRANDVTREARKAVERIRGR